ncbi:MAG: hypothetical protein E6I51_01990 [Chloroflexi bacterium]|nr:MAG: hypothetical protein E6I51_01990 [Chloroflexota bacterium]
MGVPRVLRSAKPGRSPARPLSGRSRAGERGRTSPRGGGARVGARRDPERAGMIRLQKVLAERGVASRRRAEELMREGRVRVAGAIVRELGTRVASDARIEVDGQAVGAPQRHRYVLLNKPRGIV